MTYKVIILLRAKAELIANSRWWAEHHSLDQGLSWLETVEQQIQSLSDFPESNGLSAENEGFAFEIRDKLLGLGSRRTHRAIFTIHEQVVYVLTVRHASQDIVRPDQIKFPPDE